MNVLFLSPHFPPQFWLFCSALKAEGATVLGIADAPWHELRPELQQALTDYIHVPQMENGEAVLRATALLVHRHGRLDRIDSHNEHWLELEARLRLDFNVWGQRPADTARNRSKTGMREIFRAAGIPCSEGERFQSPAQARAFVGRCGLPVVFKPDVGVGAARTFKVSTHAELERTLTEPLDGFVIERFEPGHLTSFDGLVDRDGRIVFALSHVFSSGVMDIVNERRTMFYYSRRDLPPLLEEYGRRAVEAFGIRERFFHFEFFVEQGGFRALEGNIRPPGGFTTDMMNWSCDIDVYKLWAQVVTGKDLSGFRYERLFHIAHVGRRTGVTYRLDHEALLRELGVSVVWHHAMPPVLAGAMGDYIYMLREKNEAKLLELIGRVGAT